MSFAALDALDFPKFEPGKGCLVDACRAVLDRSTPDLGGNALG